MRELLDLSQLDQRGRRLGFCTRGREGLWIKVEFVLDSFHVFCQGRVARDGERVVGLDHNGRRFDGEQPVGWQHVGVVTFKDWMAGGNPTTLNGRIEAICRHIVTMVGLGYGDSVESLVEQFDAAQSIARFLCASRYAVVGIERIPSVLLGKCVVRHEGWLVYDIFRIDVGTDAEILLDLVPNG